MMKDKKKKIVTGIVGLFTLATLAMFGISGETVIEVDYDINTSQNISEMSVYPPEEMSVDIVELYCNNEFVTRTVLPKGKLKTIPFVFTNLENLEVRFYKLSECIGVGNFKDDKLYVAVNDGLFSGISLTEQGVTDDEN